MCVMKSYNINYVCIQVKTSSPLKLNKYMDNGKQSSKHLPYVGS